MERGFVKGKREKAAPSTGPSPSAGGVRFLEKLVFERSEYQRESERVREESGRVEKRTLSSVHV